MRMAHSRAERMTLGRTLEAKVVRKEAGEKRTSAGEVRGSVRRWDRRLVAAFYKVIRDTVIWWACDHGVERLEGVLTSRVALTTNCWFWTFFHCWAAEGAELASVETMLSWPRDHQRGRAMSVEAMREGMEGVE
jgi:hypothetical protein